MSKNTNNVRFTGGDNLTGLLKMYHEVMMKNELYDGKGAYKLSYAGGESGPSFGGNQMDIAANGDARKILFTIIVNANNKVADLFLNSSAITALKNKLVPDLKTKTALDFKDLLGAPEQVFGAKMTNTINKLLASDYGRQAIDQAYVSEIQTKAKKIEEIVAGIKQPAAREFYSTTKGKVLLFDFDNQYGITKSGPDAKLVHFLNDGKTTTYSKNNISFSEQYNIDHHKQFVMGTKQAQNPQFMKNSAMRISNIENILGASQTVGQKVEEAKQTEWAQMSAARLTSARGAPYLAQAGDSLLLIAQRNNMSLSQLLPILGNEQFTDSQYLQDNHKAILHPLLSNEKEPTKPKTQAINKQASGFNYAAALKGLSINEGKQKTQLTQNKTADAHTAPKGDDLSKIAQQNNITSKEPLNTNDNKQFSTKQNAIRPNQKVEVTSSTQPNKTTKIEYINKLIALITAKVQAIVTTTTTNLQNKIQEDFDKDKTLLNKKYQNIYDTKKEELQKQLSAELAEITKQKQKEHDILWNARVVQSKAKQAADPSYSVDINSNDIVALKAAEGNSLAKEKEKSAAALLEKFRISLIKEQRDDVEKTRLKWQKDATSKHDEFVSVCNKKLNNIIEAASESAQNEHSNVNALFEKAEHDMQEFLSGATKELFAD